MFLIVALSFVFYEKFENLPSASLCGPIGGAIFRLSALWLSASFSFRFMPLIALLAPFPRSFHAQMHLALPFVRVPRALLAPLPGLLLRRMRLGPAFLAHSLAGARHVPRRGSPAYPCFSHPFACSSVRPVSRSAPFSPSFPGAVCPPRIRNRLRSPHFVPFKIQLFSRFSVIFVLYCTASEHHPNRVCSANAALPGLQNSPNPQNPAVFTWPLSSTDRPAFPVVIASSFWYA